MKKVRKNSKNDHKFHRYKDEPLQEQLEGGEAYEDISQDSEETVNLDPDMLMKDDDSSSGKIIDDVKDEPLNEIPEYLSPHLSQTYSKEDIGVLANFNKQWED